MPLREHGCESCNTVTEMYHPSIDPATVPTPDCPHCHQPMQMLYSIPQLDTSSTFHPFDTTDVVTGKKIHLSNLHELRAYEHSTLATGHNVRFDAYSAEPSNPDPVDGFGPEHWDGKATSTKGTGFMMPTM